MTPVLLRARPYWCAHRIAHIPYWMHRGYEVEIVGHGWTQAPSRRKVIEWALDWLACDEEDPGDWEVLVEWN